MTVKRASIPGLLAALLSIVAAVALIGPVAYGSGRPPHGPMTGDVQESNPSTQGPWPTNARGQTYGITVDCQEPDLIRVVATNNKVGYSFRAELDGPTPSSPEEALRWQAEQAGRSRVIPVYQSDGMTQIGVFRIGGPDTDR